MLPRYGRSLARRYCTGAGFFNLPRGVVVAPSFGRRCEEARPIYSFVTCDGEDIDPEVGGEIKSSQSRSQLETPTLLRQSLEMRRGERAYPYTDFGSS